MSRFTPSRPVAYAIVVAGLVAAAAFWWLNRAPDSAPNLDDERTGSSEVGSTDSTPSEASPELNASSRPAPSPVAARGNDRTDSAASTQEAPLPPTVAERYAQLINEEDPALDDLANLAKDVAECHANARTRVEYERSLRFMQRRMERAPPSRNNDEIYDRWVRHLENGYEKCQGTTTEMLWPLLEDLRRHAFEGVEGAASAYYSAGAGFLQWMGLRYGEEAAEFGDTMRVLLESAIADGDTGALRSTARAYAEGSLFERDPQAAYAYYLAWSRATGKPLDGMHFTTQTADHLSAEEIAIAEEHALEIFERCCG